MLRSARRTFIILVSALMCAGSCALVAFALTAEPDSSQVSMSALPEPRSLSPVVISRPAGPPRVDLGIVNGRGELVTASCTTCHNSREPNAAMDDASDLEFFHQGLTFDHGSLRCLSCHHPDDYDSLRLADGRSVAYPDVMTLCAQCHGPQKRDYDHGAHGGMTGYWDRSRGPRVRNNCVDCHDPHAPAFPMMHRTFKPIDRFLSPEGQHGDSGDEH